MAADSGNGMAVSDNGYQLIYYTGKRSLVLERDLPSNIFIYEGRPNLDQTISEIILSIASGQDLEMSSANGGLKTVNFKTSPSARVKLLLEKALSIYSTDDLFNYAMGESNMSNSALDLDPLVDAVDYQGVMSLMQHLLKGDSCKFIKGRLNKKFELLSGADGLMGLQEFESFMNLMVGTEDEEADSMSMASSRLRSRFSNKNLSSSAESRIGAYLSGKGGAGKCSVKNWRSELYYDCILVSLRGDCSILSYLTFCNTSLSVLLWRVGTCIANAEGVREKAWPGSLS